MLFIIPLVLLLLIGASYNKPKAIQYWRVSPDGTQLLDSLIFVPGLNMYMTVAAGSLDVGFDSTSNLIVRNLQCDSNNVENGIYSPNVTLSHIIAADDTVYVNVSYLSAGVFYVLSGDLFWGDQATNDSSIVDIFIEPAGGMIFNTVHPEFLDSMVVHSYNDSSGGNFFYLADSTGTESDKERWFQVAFRTPARADSIRNFILQAYVTDDSIYVIAQLASRPFTESLVDSAVGGSMLARDSTNSTSLDSLIFSDIAVEPYQKLWLLYGVRRQAGAEAKAGLIGDAEVVCHVLGPH